MWAIGTGKTPLVKDVELLVKYIKEVVCEEFSPKADKIEIIYGGSVDNKNASTFAKINGLNGLLVGQASLEAEKLLQIIKQL